MTAQSTIAPARHAPELLGQTVVVIGGSASIGLETTRRRRTPFVCRCPALLSQITRQ